MHAWFASLTTAAATHEHVAEVLRQTAVDANQSLISELFQFRNIGIPSAHHWSTQHNGASFGADYLSRTAMDKANIFVNSGHQKQRPAPQPRRITHTHRLRRPANRPDLHTNWLPAPNDDSCLYLRAYWPEPPVIDGTWTPPAIKRTE